MAMLNNQMVNHVFFGGELLSLCPLLSHVDVDCNSKAVEVEWPQELTVHDPIGETS